MLTLFGTISPSASSWRLLGTCQPGSKVSFIELLAKHGYLEKVSRFSAA
jgi:hypothetical protein